MSNPKQTFFLGTAVKITSVVSIPSPTSVKITIYDPGYGVVVNSEAMSAETTTVYSYVYQSDVTKAYGDYIAHIDAVYGSYTARMEVLFTLRPLLSTGIMTPIS